MPQCSFKNCKNNYRKSNVSVGVSYFRFPSNPFTCAEWISIVVARERMDNFYKPAKNSVICSDHFDKVDIRGNTNRRTLVKNAIPKLQIQLIPNEGLQLTPPITQFSDSDTDVVMPLSPTCGLNITQKANCNQDQADHTSVMTSPVASVSDLISVCESPRKRFLNKQLFAARKIIDTKTKRIQTLQKVNKRLVKKISSLKTIVKLLKKKQTLDETIIIYQKMLKYQRYLMQCRYMNNKKQRKKLFQNIRQVPENLP